MGLLVLTLVHDSSGKLNDLVDSIYDENSIEECKQHIESRILNPLGYEQLQIHLFTPNSSIRLWICDIDLHGKSDDFDGISNWWVNSNNLQAYTLYQQLL